MRWPAILFSLVISQNILTQNKAPLSFDPDNIPFNTIVQYAFRSDEHYYKYAYEGIKSLFNSDPPTQMRLRLNMYGTSNESNFFSALDKDSIPYAERVTFEGGIGSKKIMFYYIYHHRAFYYFSTSKKWKKDEDAYIYGVMFSGISSPMLGYHFDWISVFLSWNKIWKRHKFDDNFNLLDVYQKALYTRRYNEVRSRLVEYGIPAHSDGEIKERLSLFLYSNYIRTGGVIASNYFYLDHNFSSFLNIQRSVEFGNLPDFSQIDIHVTDVVNSITGIKLEPLLIYDIRFNYGNQWFKKYQGAHSNIELDLGIHSPQIDIGYHGKLLFDHSANITAYQRNELYFKIFKGTAGLIFGWGKVNPTIFIPDPDQLHRNEIWIIGFLEASNWPWK